MSSTQASELSSSPADEPLGAGFDFSDPNSPLARYYLRASHVIAVAFVAAVFMMLNYVPLWHTDIWGHLKFGQWITEHRALPCGEPFTPFGAAPSQFPHHGWLSQAGLYWVFHAGESWAGGERLERMAGGVELLRLTHALLVGLRLFLLFLAFRRVSGSVATACGALAVTIAISVGNLAVFRPQVFGELFFAVVLWSLSRPIIRQRMVIAMPLLFVVWANAHGSFLAGLMLLGAALLGRMLDVVVAEPKRWVRTILGDPQCRRLTLALALTVVCVGLLNPSGVAIVHDALGMASHPNVRAMDEWQPLWAVPWGGGHYAYLIPLALLAGTQLQCTRWFSASTLVLLLLFGIQPLIHQRMLIWWLMMTPWLMVRYWPDCELGCLTRWSSLQSVPSLRKTVLAVGLLGVAGMWSIPVQWLLAGRTQPLEKVVSSGTPWRIAETLRDPAQATRLGMAALAKEMGRLHPNGFRGGIFASETLGDYFVWELAPDVPVFIYTHVHEFSPEHWQECWTVRAGAPTWRSVLNRHRINLVVVEVAHHAKLCEQLRTEKGWRVVLDEADSAAKRDPRTRLFVALRSS